MNIEMTKEEAICILQLSINNYQKRINELNKLIEIDEERVKMYVDLIGRSKNENMANELTASNQFILECVEHQRNEVKACEINIAKAKRSLKKLYKLEENSNEKILWFPC